MKLLKLSIVVLFLSMLALPLVLDRVAHSQTGSPATDAETPLTEKQAADLAATTDQANKVSGDDKTAANDPVDDEGVAAGTTDTFSYDPDTDPAAAAGENKAATGDAALCPLPPPIKAAPADFDNKTNGVIPQGTPVTTTTPTPGNFEADKFIFSAVDEIKPDGLGPVYNAQSCRECHQNPVTGAISQINELRAGHNLYCNSNNVCGPDPCPPPQVCTTKFVDAPGGSLINDRSIPTKNTITPPFFGAKLQERVPPLYTAGIVGGGGPILGPEKVRTFRTSLNTLGDGFVEAIANRTLLNIAADQVSRTGGQVHGQAIRVPVLESSGCDPNNPPTCRKRVGRFGWKDQHASLLSFSGDAYLNEIGITNFLILMENTSLGRSVAAFDPVPDNQPCDDDPSKICGEDTEKDIVTFTEFMRATKAPPQDPDIQNAFSADINAGKKLFNNMPGVAFSCSICHVPKIVTAPPCTLINGGTFRIPNALGNKIIQPFSDFLLHDVNTGDGIVQNGGQLTRTKVRTPPLWGVRTRDRLMHDGESLTFREAIMRHGNEAQPVITAFNLTLTETQRRQLIMYLESL
ncbi:MAG: di-heme oxidoredictase family protein [Pyrinomonadaceae bacterium]